MKSKKINFTEKAIAALPIPSLEDRQQTYHDTGTTDGLMLIITYGGTKTYYFYMLFQGRPTRVKIGRVGDIKLADARNRAHTLREDATKGIDPSAKRKEDLNDITLKQFYKTIYRPEYSVIHKKAGSIANDDSIFNHRLKDFQNKRLLSITQDDVERLHNNTKKELSPYTANRVLSLIKHIYVIAIKQGYVRRDANPAEFLKKFPEQSRDRFLQPDEIKQLWTALATEPNEVFKAYILISLFTAIRRSNVLSMRWSDVDLLNDLIYIPESKNGEPQQVPITEEIKSILEDMKSRAKSEWVLPSNKANSGHLEDPKRPWQDLLARADIKNLRLHDLRRTRASYQAITGSSLHVIGASLGHKSMSATQVYARLSADPIRESIQKANSKMMEFVEKL
jgi:integrase